MKERAYWLWDELEVGRRFKPYEYVLRQEEIDEYVRAVQEQTAFYLSGEEAEAAGLKKGIAPPTMAAVYVNKAIRQIPAPPGNIHAKQYYHFYRPAYAGDKLVTTVCIEDKYVKRDKKYVVVSSETFNQHGELVVKTRMTRIWAK